MNSNFTFKPMIDEDLAKQIDEISKQFVEMSKVISSYINPLQEQVTKLIRKITPINKVLARMSSVQYVCWSTISDDVISLSNDIEKNQDFVQKLIDLEELDFKTLINQKFIEYKIKKSSVQLFNEIVNSFEYGNFNLCLTGLCSFIDGLLSFLTEDFTTSIKNRINELVNKLNQRDELNEKEYSDYSLFVTVRDTFKLYGERKPFDGDEPDCINRHWIVHGRRTILASKYDCIKLFRLIYSLFLFN